MPPTSVLKPRRRAASKSTVLAAPASTARSSTSSRSGSTSCFRGIVSERPRHDASRESRNAGNEPPSTSMAVYSQSSPSCAYAARCNDGLFECSIGEPRTASRTGVDSAIFGMLIHPCEPLVDGGPVLLDGRGEDRLIGVEVPGHEEHPW